MSKSILDKGLTTGGASRLTWFIPPQLSVASADANVVSYHITIDSLVVTIQVQKLITKADITKKLLLVALSIQLSQLVFKIATCKMEHTIVEKNTVLATMTLPIKAVKGTTILFEIEVTLDTIVSDIVLSYYAESDYGIRTLAKAIAEAEVRKIAELETEQTENTETTNGSVNEITTKETFQLTSLPNEGIELLDVDTDEQGRATYKWKCRVAPEVTRELKNNNFMTYCRLFFGEDVAELEKAPLAFTEGKPNVKPTIQVVTETESDSS
ncbi:MAG: hypothetical protein F6K31_28405 [Symploca sp. SIO2G7]|nr:hypothetical protein [Symploca sp. SIO2G7]